MSPFDQDGLHVKIGTQPSWAGPRQPAWGTLVCDCGEVVMTWTSLTPPTLGALNMAAYGHRELTGCGVTPM
jgi:hypothetical protein